MLTRHQPISESEFKSAEAPPPVSTSDKKLIADAALGIFTLAEDTVVVAKMDGVESQYLLVAGRKVIPVETNRRAMRVESGAVLLPGGSAGPLKTGSHLRLVKQ